MDSMISAIGPLSSNGLDISANRGTSRKDATKEFVSIFIKEVMKDVFKSQSTMFADESDMNMFSDSLYNDILLNKITSDIAGSQAYRFDQLLTRGK